MSIVVTTDVFCDACGEWVHGTTSPRVERDNARAIARRAGWTYTAATDLCPHCSARRDQAATDRT